MVDLNEYYFNKDEICEILNNNKSKKWGCEERGVLVEKKESKQGICSRWIGMLFG